ncbi:ABC transporter ATP-binding protein [Cellulomonas persica]|uniref:ABC transporter domain-containing protein n=1 Tax=Cellulomonas persica TaxID=76861 RepID=A0A510UR62_9CELL|nr:ABC transporter ATP-binding protein [Cellulomonas persica]GEK17154.1 hypothetical protein CPE01_08870 [Cellulomonas persica]
MSSLSASDMDTQGAARRTDAQAAADNPAVAAPDAPGAEPQAATDSSAVVEAPAADAPAADGSAVSGEGAVSDEGGAAQAATPQPGDEPPADAPVEDAPAPETAPAAAVTKPRIERTYPVDPDAPPAVSVQDLTITYRTTFEKVPTIKSAIVRLGRGERAVREVHALQGLTFDVMEGTALGIIGANGAGKSTLMRALAGVLPPTSGRIEVRGEISSLLSLGVGFNGALSGRENVMLGGLAQGLTRAQVAERAEEIAEFAELGDFMDLPLRTYSAGMAQRLAFAVSVHMEPDILLIDEALSAGDARFKNKAAAKMDELMSSARAMFLVSHSLASIRELCNDAIWIHEGRLMMRGTPQACGDAYTRFLEVGENAFTLEDL